MVDDSHFNDSNSLSRIFALLTILIGLLSALGWIFDISFLKAIIPQLIAIKFNTAFCILLLGLTACSISFSLTKKYIVFNRVASLIVFAITFATLLQYASNVNFGIDEFVFKDTEITYSKPGRMPVISATILSLTSFTVFFRSIITFSIGFNFIQVFNLFLAGLALLGYLYGASGLLTVFQYKSIAPQTIVAFLCLNLSLLLSDKSSPILKPFLSNLSGGIIGRKLLLTSIFTLIVVGLGVRRITQYYNIDASVDGVIVVTLSLVFFSIFIWELTRRLNLIDSKLIEKHEALEELNAQLEQRVIDRTEDLKKSEKKFRETVELAADGIFEANLDGVYSKVNLSGCKMLGYEEHELIGKTIMDIIPKEDIPKLNQALNRHGRSGEIIQLEWNLLKKDGSVLPVEISSRTVKGNRIVAFVRDVTLRKQAELDLVMSEKKFRNLFEGAYDAILVADEAGRITMVNEQLAKKFGYRREELIGEPVEILIPERFKAVHVENRKSFVRDAHSRPMGAGLDLFGRKRDGTEFPVDISLSPTVTDEGLRITAIIRDITERKKFEEQQKFLAEMGKILAEGFGYDEKIEKLAELLVAKVADTCIIKVVEHDELVYKASTTRKKELSEEFKVIAKKIVMPGKLGSLYVLQTGKPLIIEDVQEEIIDNRDVDDNAKKLISEFGAKSYAVFPLISQGRPVGTLVLSINDKSRKFTKEDGAFLEIVTSRCAVALENARLQKYSHLAEVVTNNLPSMIAYWDKNEVCQFANRVYLDWFGISPDKIIGKTLIELLGPDLYQKNKPYIVGALDGKTQQFERDLVLKATGKTRHTSALYIPDLIKGKVVGFFVLVVDVTELKMAELEALSQKERAERAVHIREEVLAIVSHDLKNPLATVSLSADVLNQEQPLAPTMVRDCGQRIQRAVKQMQSLISDLLDFAKMQSSTFALELSDESPNEIVLQVVDSFKELARQKEITVQVDLPTEIKRVACDQGRIVQVLSNLIGNSVKFTSKGGKITVSAKNQGQNLLMSVADTGPGMTPEQLPLVFDRFWQAENTKKLGSGLGLSIAKGIITAHGGDIWVESKIGVGTTFFFTLPYVQGPRFRLQALGKKP